MRWELGRKAKGIRHEYATELPWLFQPIPVNVKEMLIQKGIIDSQFANFSTLGMSAEFIASELYETVVTSLENNPFKFAEELEEAGTSVSMCRCLQE